MSTTRSWFVIHCIHRQMIWQGSAMQDVQTPCVTRQADSRQLVTMEYELLGSLKAPGKLSITNTSNSTYIHKEEQRRRTKEHNAPRSRLQASPNKYIFSFCLKTGNVRFGHRRSAGSSFHNWGPAAVKLLSPNRLCIRMSLEPERSGRRPISDGCSCRRGTWVLRPLATGGPVRRS